MRGHSKHEQAVRNEELAVVTRKKEKAKKDCCVSQMNVLVCVFHGFKFLVHWWGWEISSSFCF